MKLQQLQIINKSEAIPWETKPANCPDLGEPIQDKANQQETLAVVKKVGAADIKFLHLIKDRQLTTSKTSNQPERPLSNAMVNGIRCKCSSCGNGNLYEGFNRVKYNCDDCAQELFHHRADDYRPSIRTFPVGHLVIALLMFSMKYELFSMWTTAIGGSLFAMVISVALMRPIKGLVISLQWALRMHGFDKTL